MNILDALEQITGCGGVGRLEGGYRLDFADGTSRAATAQEIAQAQAYIDAEPIRAAQQAKADATAGVDRGSQRAGNATERKIVALVGLILDEFNTHAARQSALVAQILAASSLADLKTRVTNNVNPIPQRTRAQLVAAIKNKIAETGE